MSLKLDQHYYRLGYTSILGTDEAGRGPLAGPVVAASVLLPKDFYHPDIDDSKKLTEKKRELLFDVIMHHAIAYRVEVIDAEVIDKINILEASRFAMTRCVQAITSHFDIVLTDAMTLPKITKVPVEPIIRGDAQSLSIASASILAKVTRDRLMFDLDHAYPKYGFKNHKGYPTKMHIQAIQTFGVIAGIHRKTFAPVKKFLTFKR
jgi:ribonuclease HII